MIPGETLSSCPAVANTVALATSKPVPDPLICAACGEPITGNQRWTIAAWFTCGTPRDCDIVHARCRFKRRPYRGKEAGR